MTYDAILFDFDGVLIDSEPAHYNCWMEVLAPLGMHITWDEYVDQYIGADDKLMIGRLCAAFSVSYETAWALYPEKKKLFEAQPRVIADDVVAMLRRLAVPLAVVTSSAQSEVEPILHDSGVLPLLQTVVYGGDVARMKPAPDPYLLAAGRIGAMQPLVVEDSPAGIQAGKAAGFEVLQIRAQQDVVTLVEARLTQTVQP